MAKQALAVVGARQLSWRQRWWRSYQNWHPVFRIGVPFALSVAMLSGAWSVLGQDEYGVAFALVVLFLALGLTAVLETRWRGFLKIIVGVGVVLVALYSLAVIWKRKGDKPLTTLWSQTKPNKQQQATTAPPAPVSSPTPWIIVDVGRIGTGNPKTYPGALSLFLVINVTNLGAPSIVTDYKLIIEIPGREPLRLLPTHPGRTLTLTQDDGRSTTYSSEEAIYDKTAERPVPTNGSEKGFLWFIVRGVTRQDLHKDGVTFKLLYKDARGTPYSLSFVTGGIEMPLQHYPGMKEERVTLPKRR
jgi:hypothetical protein